MDESVRRAMTAIRVYLVFMALLVATFFVINMVQAHQTGRGLGVHDTSIVPPNQAQLYREDLEPRR